MCSLLYPLASRQTQLDQTRNLAIDSARYLKKHFPEQFFIDSFVKTTNIHGGILEVISAEKDRPDYDDQKLQTWRWSKQLAIQRVFGKEMKTEIAVLSSCCRLSILPQTRGTKTSGIAVIFPTDHFKSPLYFPFPVELKASFIESYNHSQHRRYF